MNISNQVERGILKATVKIGLAATAGILIAAATPKVINATSKAYDDVKDRIETERAIRAEGIQAKSYAEAKAKLDSIDFSRICAELGVTVPQKPVFTGDYNTYRAQMINYDLDKMSIYSKHNSKQLQDLQSKLEQLRQ